MPKIHIIEICSDFSKYPAGRYKTDGPYSGQHFLEDFLLPALKEPDTTVEVDMDGTLGYGSSFLQAAFGDLVTAGYTESELQERLFLKSKDKSFVVGVWCYISEVEFESN